MISDFWYPHHDKLIFYKPQSSINKTKNEKIYNWEVYNQETNQNNRKGR